MRASYPFVNKPLRLMSTVLMSIVLLAQHLIGKVSNEYPSVFLLGFDTFSCQVPSGTALYLDIKSYSQKVISCRFIGQYIDLCVVSKNQILWEIYELRTLAIRMRKVALRFNSLFIRAYSTFLVCRITLLIRI